MTKLTLFKRIYLGFKIALGVAIGLRDHGRIKVKELDAIKDAVDSIDNSLQTNLPPSSDGSPNPFLQ